MVDYLIQKYLLLPIDVRLGRETCLGQWEMRSSICHVQAEALGANA